MLECIYGKLSSTINLNLKINCRNKRYDLKFKIKSILNIKSITLYKNQTCQI